MKKMYTISDILTPKEIQYLFDITKQLTHYVRNRIKSMIRFNLVINSQWKLVIQDSMIEMQVTVSPVSTMKIVKYGKDNKESIEVEQEKYGKSYRISDSDGYFFKIISYLNKLISQYSINWEKQCKIDLNFLGSVCLQNKKVDYFNEKNERKWGLIQIEAKRIRLDKMLRVSNLDERIHEVGSDKNLVREKRCESVMSRKFSVNSFKSYNSHNSNDKDSKNAKGSLQKIKSNSQGLIFEDSIKKDKLIKEKMGIIKGRIERGNTDLNGVKLKGGRQQNRFDKRLIQSKQHLTINKKKIEQAEQNFNGKENIKPIRNLNKIISIQQNLYPFRISIQSDPQEIKKHWFTQGQHFDKSRQLHHFSDENKKTISNIGFNSHKFNHSSNYEEIEEKSKIKKLSDVTGTEKDICFFLQNLQERQRQIKSYQKCSLSSLGDQRKGGVQMNMKANIVIEKRRVKSEKKTQIMNNSIKVEQNKVQVVPSNLSKLIQEKRVRNIQKLKEAQCKTRPTFNKSKVALNTEKLKLFRQNQNQEEDRDKEKQPNLQIIKKLVQKNRVFNIQRDSQILFQLIQVYYQKKSEFIKQGDKRNNKKTEDGRLNRSIKNANPVTINTIEENLKDRKQVTKLQKQLLFEMHSHYQIFEKQKLYLRDPSGDQLNRFIEEYRTLFEQHNGLILNKIRSMIEIERKKEKQQNLRKLKFLHYQYNVKYHQREEKKEMKQTNLNQPREQIDIKIQELNSRLREQTDEIHQQYFYSNTFLPYFYQLSNNLSQILLLVFENSSTRNPSIINLTQVSNLSFCVYKYIDNIENLYSKLLQFINLIPEKNFHLPLFKQKLIYSYIQKKREQLEACSLQWSQMITKKYQAFENIISEIENQLIQFRSETNKGGSQAQLKYVETKVKVLQSKVEQLTESTTLLYCGNYILDTNLAKEDLMKRYENLLGSIYQIIYEKMSQISLAWSQQMIKSERLTASELTDQKEEIINKIKVLGEDYYRMVRFYFLERRFFYIQTDELKTGSFQKSSLKKSTCKSFKMSQKRIRRDLNSSVKSQVKNMESFKQECQKCTNYCYNIAIKNCEKIKQINYLVQSHKEKILLVSKSLQIQEKQFRLQRSELTNQLKKIVISLKSKTDLLKLETKIKQIQSRYQLYLQEEKKLHEQMVKNMMIVWEEDEYLSTTISLALRAISFIDSDLFIKINHHSLDGIRFTHFFRYYKNLEKLMNSLQGHKLEDLFKSDYNLTQDQFQFLEMVLYKDYSVFQIEQIYNYCGIDLKPGQTTFRVYECLKMYRSKTSIFSEIERVYVSRKKEKYQKNLIKPVRFEFQLSLDRGKTVKIVNLEEIKMLANDWLESQNKTVKMQQNIKNQIKVIEKIRQIYQNIYEHEIILKQIGIEIPEQEYVSFELSLKKLKMFYEHAVHSFRDQSNFQIVSFNNNKQKNINGENKENSDRISCDQNSKNVIIKERKKQEKNRSVNFKDSYRRQRDVGTNRQLTYRSTQLSSDTYTQKQWEKLLVASYQLRNLDIKSKFFNSLSQICNRLMMISYQNIIYLLDWTCQSNILRNMKIIFPEVVDIQFGQNSTIVAIYVCRGKKNDRIEIASGPIMTQNIDKFGQFIRHIQNQVQKSLLGMIKNSHGRSGQIKILGWLLYFTEQVQQSIITNTSLKILKANLMGTIEVIKSDLRYDIKNHKQEEITQINSFINYIESYLSQFPDINGYEWISTIRYYEKNKCVMIQQNNFEYYYGFEPKNIQTIVNLNWNLDLGLSYGDISLRQRYKMKSFFIAAPYFQLNDKNFPYLFDEKSVARLISIIQKNSYICTLTLSGEEEIKIRTIYNSLHKQLVKFYLKRQNQDTNVKDNSFVISDAQNSREQSREKQKIFSQYHVGQGNWRKGKISIYLCYENYQSIPECFVKLYRCRNTSSVSPANLTLKIHLLVANSNLKDDLKSKLVWKLIKLCKSMNKIKDFSQQQMMGILGKVVQMIEYQNGISKEVKNSIYRFIADNFVSNFSEAANIINQIFIPQDLISYRDLCKSFESGVQQRNSIDLIQGNSFSSMSRKMLLERLESQYLQIQKSNTQKLTIIIYGEQPSCKTTFITKHLGLKLGEKNGYIQSSFLSPMLIKQFYHLDNKKYKKFFKVIQAGKLSQIDPSILSQSILLYSPSISIENNNGMYLDQLKKYFLMRIIENGGIQDKYVLDKCWVILFNTYKAYMKVVKMPKRVNFEGFLDMSLKIVTHFLMNSSYWKLTQQFSLPQNIKSNRNKQFVILILLIAYELLGFSLRKAKRKLFLEQVKKLITAQPIKIQIKIEDIQTFTYTEDGQNVKFDNNLMVKLINSMMPKDKMMMIPLLSRQVSLVNKYLRLGMNICLIGNSFRMFKDISEILKMMSQRKNGGQKQQKCTFSINLKINGLSKVYSKVEKIWRKKKEKIQISKSMVSGKIMELVSKGTIHGQDHSQLNMKEKEKRILLIIDDVHFGTPENISFLGCILNRNENSENLQLEKEQKELFVLFKNREVYGKSFSNRLRRFVAEISLYQLDLQTIFKYKAQFMMNQEQCNIILELFQIGLFDSFGKDQQKVEYALLQKKIEFALETSVKMPSQFYSKYLFNKLSLLCFCASPINVGQTNYKIQTVMHCLQEQIQKSATSSKFFEKIKDKETKNFQNANLFEQPNKIIEIELKKVESETKVFKSTLPFEQQLICSYLSSHLSIFLSQKTYFVASDPLNLLIRLMCWCTKRNIKTLTHKYMEEIIKEISGMRKNKQSSLVMIVPEYLLHFKQFLPFLKSFICKNEILIQNQQLFSYWWQTVEEYEFIHNKYEQFQEIKRQIEQVLKRIIFIVKLDTLNFQQALSMIFQTKVLEGIYVQQFKERDKGQKPNEKQQDWFMKKEICKLKKKTSLDKNVDQSRLNRSNMLNFSQRDQKDESSEQQQRLSQQKPVSYQVLRNIICVDTELSQQIQCKIIEQVFVHYSKDIKCNEDIKGYFEICQDYLQKIIYKSRQKTTQTKNGAKNQNNKDMFYLIVELIPQFCKRISQIYYSEDEKKVPMPNHSKLETLNLISSFNNQINGLFEKVSTLKQKLDYFKCYYSLLCNLHQGLNQVDESEQISQEEKYKKRVISFNSYYQYSNFGESEVQKLFASTKLKFLQREVVEKNFKEIKIYESTEVIESIKNCLMCHEQEAEFPNFLDFILQESEQINSKDISFMNYFDYQKGFLRLFNMDSSFIKVMYRITMQIQQQLLQTIGKHQKQIYNYEEFVNNLKYLFQLNRIFKSICLPKLSKDESNIMREGFLDVILEEYKMVQYINEIDSISILKNIMKSLQNELQREEKIKVGFERCVQFLVEYGNHKTTISQKEGEKYERNIDSEIKITIFQIISRSILSKLVHNCSLYYEIYEGLELNKKQNALLVMDRLQLIYSFKWQQIQFKIFWPLIQSIASIRFNLPISLQQLKQSKKGKTNQKQAAHSQQTYPKYAIVHDPEGQFIRYSKHKFYSEDEKHFKHKLIYLNNQESEFMQTENFNKLNLINHVPTFYTYHFFVDMKNLNSMYQKNLANLNRILRILKQKQSSGKGHNDKLIVLVHQKFLCDDIRNNAQFQNDQLLPDPNHKHGSSALDVEEKSKLVIIESLQLTQLDIIQYFKQSSNNSISFDLHDSHSFESSKFHYPKSLKLVRSLKSSKSLERNQKNIQLLHNDYNTSKIYLKMIVKSLLGPSERQHGNEFKISQSTFNCLMKSFQDFENRKKQMLEEFYKQKVFKFQYFNQKGNQKSLETICSIFKKLVQEKQVPMDFLMSIGAYIKIESLTQAAQSGTKVQRNSRYDGINKHKKGKSIFYNSANHRQEVSQEYCLKLIKEYYDKYKQTFSSNIYKIKGDREQINFQEKKKIFYGIAAEHEILILVYEKLENWVLKVLIDHNQGSKIQIVFENEPEAFKMYLQSTMMAAISSTTSKTKKKIFFLVHEKNLESVHQIFHTSKIFWI